MSHKHWKLVEEEEPAHGACPHCGACSCCGRGATPVVYPYPYITQPWPTYPYTVWSSTTTLSPFANGASGGFIGSASIVEVSQ